MAKTGERNDSTLVRGDDGHGDAARIARFRWLRRVDRIYVWSAIGGLVVAAALIELAIAMQNRGVGW